MVEMGCKVPALYKFYMHLPSDWSLCHSQITRQGVAVFVIANKGQNGEELKFCQFILISLWLFWCRNKSNHVCESHYNFKASWNSSADFQFMKGFSLICSCPKAIQTVPELHDVYVKIILGIFCMCNYCVWFLSYHFTVLLNRDKFVLY